MLTFHKILAGCEAGDRESWRAFLSDYTPVIFQLARIYFPDRPSGRPTPAEFWREALDAVCSDNYKLLRTFGHQSERELLIDLRAFFLERFLASAGPDEITLGKEDLAQLFKELPLLHQEIAFFKLAGYSDQTLEQMLRTTPGVAQKSLERLRNGQVPVPEGGDRDACPWPSRWLELLKDARAVKTEACPPLRLLVRIQDGQMGWYEKEPAEKHLGQCLHCLEAWTGLREIGYWRSSAPPVPAEDLQTLVSAVPVREEAKKPAPLLKRIFG